MIVGLNAGSILLRIVDPPKGDASQKCRTSVQRHKKPGPTGLLFVCIPPTKLRGNLFWEWSFGVLESAVSVAGVPRLPLFTKLYINSKP